MPEKRDWKTPVLTFARRFLTGLALGALIGLVVKDLDLPSALSYWNSRAPIVVACAAITALLFLTRLRVLLALVALGLGGLWVAAAFTPLSARLARPMLRVEPASRAADKGDAIFVFASSLQKDGDPSPMAMTRLFHGLELLEEGRAPRIIVSELPPPYAPYAPVAKAWMQRFKIPGEVLSVGPVKSTHDEGVLVAQLAQKNGWKKIVAVSSPVHGQRASRVLEHEGLEVVFSPATETEYDLDNLDLSDDRIRAFGAGLHEQIGIRVYKLRGWIGK